MAKTIWVVNASLARWIQEELELIDFGEHGRRAAAALGVPFIGTIGVVLRARAEGRIESAASVLQQLRLRGLRFDDALVATALQQVVGETWKP